MKSLFSKLKSRIANPAPDALETPQKAAGVNETAVTSEPEKPAANPGPGAGILRRPARLSPQANEAPAWHSKSTATAPKNAGVNPPEKEAPQKIAMELGDFIRRIPADLLTEGPHDLSQRVWFKVSDISANVAQGKPTIPLSQIYRMCPEIFRGEVTPERDAGIYFPWNKLVAQLRAARAGSAEKSADGFSEIALSLVPVQKRSALTRREPVTEGLAPAANLPQAGDTHKPPLSSLKAKWQNRAEQTPPVPITTNDAEPPVEANDKPAQLPSQDFVRLPPQPVEPLPKSEMEEFSEKLAEAQQQTGSLQAQLEKLCAERDEALAKINSEREAHHREVAELTRGRGGASDELAKLCEEQKQQLENLRRERDSLSLEKDGVIARLTQSLDESSRRSEQLISERDSLAKKHDEIQTQLAEVREKLAKELSSLNEQFVLAASQRDEALARLAQIQAEHEQSAHLAQSAEEAKQKIEKLTAERDALGAQHSETFAQLSGTRETLAKQRDEALAQLAGLRTDHEKQIAALTEECEKVREEKQTVLARFAQGTDAAQRQIEALTAERDAALALHSKSQEAQQNQEAELLREQLGVLQQKSDAAILDGRNQLEALRRSLDNANKERDESLIELARLRETQAKQSRAQKEHVSVAASERDQLRKKLEAVEQSHRDQLAVLAQERDAVAKARDEALAQLAQERDAMKRTIDSREQDRDAALRERDAALEQQAVLKRAADEQFAELERQRAALEKEREQSFTLPRARPFAPPPPVLRIHGV